MENKNNNKKEIPQSWYELGLGYSNRTYETPAGNGTCEPQYKLDENGKMTMLKKKDGTPKTYNRYLDIQAAKESTNYKQLIENTNFDLNAVNFILNSDNPKYEWEKAVDYTDFGGIETLKSMENKIVNTFGSLEKFNEFCKKKFYDYGEMLKKQKEASDKWLKEKEAKKAKEKADFEAWKKKNGDNK